MGAISKNVIATGDWCAPTRELKNSQLLKLVHKSRKIIRETLQPVAVERDGDVVMLVDKKPSKVDGLEEAQLIEVTGSGVRYPIARDRWRPLRFVLATLMIVAAIGVVVLAVW